MEPIKLYPVNSAKLPVVGFGTSNIGGRAENQDTGAWVDTPYGFVAMVCDGMGGGPAGKTASTIAANTISAYLQDPSAFAPRALTPADADTDTGATEAAQQAKTPSRMSDTQAVKGAIAAANAAIVEFEQVHPECKGMGTTVAMVLVTPAHAVVAHVGDSRVYQMRGHRKVFRTTDHSMVFGMVKSGDITEEEARTHPRSNVITRALGQTVVDPDIEVVPYEKGDRFIICSDGIWGMRPEKEWLADITHCRSLAGSVESTAIRTNQMGQAAGSHHDNLTLEIIQVNQHSTDKEPMRTAHRNIFYTLSILLALSIIGNLIAWYAWPTHPARETSTEVLTDSIHTLNKKLQEARKGAVAATPSKQTAQAGQEPLPSIEQDTPAPENDDLAQAISLLTKASNTEDVAQRKQIINKVISLLDNQVASATPQKAEVLKTAITELKKGITLQPLNKAKGQIVVVTNNLKKLSKQ